MLADMLKDRVVVYHVVASDMETARQVLYGTFPWARRTSVVWRCAGREVVEAAPPQFVLWEDPR